MIADRSLAKLITAKIFDRIEQDRTLISAHVEDAAFEALAVAAADDSGGVRTGPDANKAVMDAAIALIRYSLDNHMLLTNIDYNITSRLTGLYRALTEAGWRYP